MPDLNVTVIYGGVDLMEQKAQLKAKPPHIVVGTPGRVKAVRRPPPRLPLRCSRA
jgi:ATP-dependent RNA helicase UAP56/SUB2